MWKITVTYVYIYIYICTTLIYLIISFLVLIIYDRVFQDRQASHTPMRPLQFPTGRKRRLWKLNLQWRAVGQKPATDLAFKYQTTMTQTTKFYQQVLSSYTIITMTLSTSYLVLPHYLKFQTLLAVGVRFHLLGSVVAAALGQRQCQWPRQLDAVDLRRAGGTCRRSGVTWMTSLHCLGWLEVMVHGFFWNDRKCLVGLLRGWLSYIGNGSGCMVGIVIVTSEMGRWQDLFFGQLWS